ncbi:MAG TPA: bacteriohopanetetrol glucosamine biosynthesis glycosyltransferase HpnI [Caulobacteraceae bacterium]|jgi:ceramide glucosyltransferase|nr:bacteriohopanetetrol glucosamine biosynthesis glycosyltransferase HpnI [Caulobacteraceae bacterium]
MNEVAASVAVGWTLAFASVVGAAYWLVAAALTRFALSKGARFSAASPGVSMVKPLHGAPSGLHEILRGFCEQDYDGPLQIVFGVHDEADPAIGIVHALQAEHPELDIELVIDSRLHGTNRKASNLVNMAGLTRHPVLVLSDADIAVAPGYVRSVVAALEAPEVGLVSCLYIGVESAGLWSKLSAMAISYRFTPSAILAKIGGLAEPCFGATIALRAETLRRIGGFAPFADHLADDYEIGRAVRALGLKISLPPMVVGHVCEQVTGRMFVDRELRSLRTVRQIDPWGHAGSILTHPLPLSLVAASLIGPWPFSLALPAGVVAARLVVKRSIDQATGKRVGRWWLVPVSDLLCFGLFIASFLVNSVDWQGARFRVSRQGALVQS